MESSLVSAYNTIQHSSVMEEQSYVSEERSTFADCFDGKYSLPPNLEKDMESEWFDVIKYTSTSDCFNGNYAPTHTPYTEDMLDLKPFDLINYITTDSPYNIPMETSSQQEQVVDPEDMLDLKPFDLIKYITTDASYNIPMETGSQQEQVVDPECKKCYQRAKQLRKRYKSAFQTIGKGQPLQSFYRSRQIAPCLGECRRTPNVSVLHHQNCVLYNMPILKELQKKYPKIFRQVKKHLTDINIDRDDFKNLLFHEKLSKMLDKIECAVKYMESCCNKYMYLAAFKLQLTELVTRGKNSHHNPNPDTLTQSNVIKFRRHMRTKINNFNELIINLMKKDMAYYQLKVDINNMLEIMSNHEYAEMVESYYNLLKLESRIDTFIENYKKVPESIKEKLDIQNNYTDCELISCYYKDYNEYLNLLINSLDETNSVPDNNSGFVEDPIISNPHLKAFYNDMQTTSYNKLRNQNRTLLQFTTESDICFFMKDLSRLLDATEELNMIIENMLAILSNSVQSIDSQDDGVLFNLDDGVLFNINMSKAKSQILYCKSERKRKYLSVKELGRMEMKKTLVYRNTKVPIKQESAGVVCMTLCMLMSLSRVSKACETVKENLSSNVCKAQGSKFQFLEEYIDYQKKLIDEVSETWFPKNR